MRKGSGMNVALAVVVLIAAAAVLLLSYLPSAPPVPGPASGCTTSMDCPQPTIPCSNGKLWVPSECVDGACTDARCWSVEPGPDEPDVVEPKPPAEPGPKIEPHQCAPLLDTRGNNLLSSKEIIETKNCFGEDYVECTYYFLKASRESQGIAIETNNMNQTQNVVAFANKGKECAYEYKSYSPTYYLPDRAFNVIDGYLGSYETCVNNGACWEMLGTRGMDDMDELILELEVML